MVMYLIVVLKSSLMKKTFLLIVSIALVQLLTAQAIPNGDFEQWDNQPVPLQWETNSRPLTAPAYDPYIVRKDTMRYSGSFAADFYANNAFKAYAKTTFAVNTYPGYLSLFYKLYFAPCVNDPGYLQQDTASVLVEMYHNGAVADNGYWESTTTSFQYSRLLIPISHNAPAYDSCRITIRGGMVNGGCGIVSAPTEFWVDHLELLDLTNTGCVDTGVVVDGVECPLISDFAIGTLLHPCTMPVGAALHLGDTITYTYTLGSCASFCMQGTDVDISCFQVLHAAPQVPKSCHANFGFQKNIDSVFFSNFSTADSVTGYIWTFGDGSTSTAVHPTHVYAHDSTYLVCLHLTALDNSGSTCIDDHCDTIKITHECIDSSLICHIPFVCCDLSLPDTVCGCDSVTYYNACHAQSFGGVTKYYQGKCRSISTGMDDPAEGMIGISISPVPARDRVSISYQTRHSGNTSIRLLNTIGQELRTIYAGPENTGLHEVQMDLSELSAGVYLLEIKNGMYTKVRRFVKE
ncbi:MAG: hypothetical protein JWO03_2388 [Bacteroidetes bacterium]|nr:hypothetical protein [Bacteroidota bacterium]